MTSDSIKILSLLRNKKFIKTFCIVDDNGEEGGFLKKRENFMVSLRQKTKEKKLVSMRFKRISDSKPKNGTDYSDSLFDIHPSLQKLTDSVS